MPISIVYMRAADAVRQEAAKIDLEALKEIGIERTHEGFYILGNYPPLTAMESCCEEELLDDNKQTELDIYVHFQFCNPLCSFCHFYTDQSASSSEDPKVLRYLENLKKEISLLNRNIGGVKARSIYVGGGTPSFMSAPQIRDIFRHIRSEFNVSEDITITFDVHPELVRSGQKDEKFNALLESGVNRIYIGGVDLNDEVIRYQNRQHTSKDVVELIQELKIKGFPHVVTDLIMGVPYQTPENWERTLEILINDCEIDCAMAFPLMFKASQPLWGRYKLRREEFPTITDRLILQLIAIERFEQAAYTHYPIYYFNRSAHHINDQQVRKFETIDETGLLAIGVSSFGFLNGHQYFNTPYIGAYYEALESDRLPIWRAAKLTPRNLFEHYVMFGLKAKGVDVKEAEKRYGFSTFEEYGPEIRELESSGLLESTDRYMKLTRLGILFAEEVCNKFAGKEVRMKAEYTASRVDPRDPIQRYNYNMLGHSVGSTLMNPVL